MSGYLGGEFLERKGIWGWFGDTGSFVSSISLAYCWWDIWWPEVLSSILFPRVQGVEDGEFKYGHAFSRVEFVIVYKIYSFH